MFKERLTPMQKVATVLAAVGVGYFMMEPGGQIWIAFALALTFGVYGAVKKRGGYPALPGMAFESLLTGVIGVAALLVGAVAPWIWQVAPPTPDPLAVKDPVAVMALLAGCGLLTAVPLLLFAGAANRVSMTVIGFIQYVSPTIALVLAVTFFNEEFTVAHGVCFALIWLGIAAVAVEAALDVRRRARKGLKPVSYTHLDVYKRQMQQPACTSGPLAPCTPCRTMTHENRANSAASAAKAP